MLMCYIDILNYFLDIIEVYYILHIILLGYAILVLFSVCLVFLAMLGASADFWDLQGFTVLPFWYCLVYA